MAHMNKQRGTSLIEGIIGLVIVAVVLIVVFSGDSTTCVGGYKHSYDVNGSMRQIVDEKGGGIPCKK